MSLYISNTTLIFFSNFTFNKYFNFCFFFGQFSKSVISNDYFISLINLYAIG